MVQVLHDTLRAEMLRDPAVVVMGQDVGIKGGVFKVTDGLHAEFGPMRVLDTPISEIVIAGAAIGAAMMGLRPVAEFQFADYMHAAYDQIVNQAATMRWRSVGAWSVPVVFRAPSGGGVHGGVYHSQSIEALYGHIPGLRVVVPATPRDAGGLLRAAIRDDDPVVFFEHKGLFASKGSPAPDGHVVELGQAAVARDGTDVTLVALASTVPLALAAAEQVGADGISAEVIDLRSLVPLDMATVLASVQRTSRLIIVEENPYQGGWGGTVASVVADEGFESLDAPIRRVAAACVPLPFADALEQEVIPTTAKVVTAIRSLVAY